MDTKRLIYNLVSRDRFASFGGELAERVLIAQDPWNLFLITRIYEHIKERSWALCI